MGTALCQSNLCGGLPRKQGEFSMSKPPSRLKRRRRRRSSRMAPVLLTIVLLAGLLYVGTRALFQEPEQKREEEPVIQTGQTEGDKAQNSGTESPEDLALQEALRSHRERKEKFFTILVSGVDDGNGGSDTNILVAVDAANGYLYGASIPRDSKAVINGKNWKINAAYNIGGMELLAETISEQLGIPVDYTVLVDLRGFEALVDAIKGVDFYVPVDMDYDDPVQDLHIHFSKGLQHLYGADALKVVRFRHNNDGTGYGSEDVGRMKTQQDFLAKQTLTLSNVDKIDDFVKIFQRHVETDLTLGNLAWLGAQMISMGSDSVNFSTLPSEWKSPYIYLDPEETLALVNQYLNPYVEDRVMEDLNIPGRG